MAPVDVIRAPLPAPPAQARRRGRFYAVPWKGPPWSEPSPANSELRDEVAAERELLETASPVRTDRPTAPMLLACDHTTTHPATSRDVPARGSRRKHMSLSRACRLHGIAVAGATERAHHVDHHEKSRFIF